MLEKIYGKSDAVVHRKIAGETILVPVRGKLADMQRIFSLNPVAEHVWDQMAGEKKLCEIIDGVLEIFNVEEVTAREDILEFVSELKAAKLIREAGGT